MGKPSSARPPPSTSFLAWRITALPYYYSCRIFFCGFDLFFLLCYVIPLIPSSFSRQCLLPLPILLSCPAISLVPVPSVLSSSSISPATLTTVLFYTIIPCIVPPPSLHLFIFELQNITAPSSNFILLLVPYLVHHQAFFILTVAVFVASPSPDIISYSAARAPKASPPVATCTIFIHAAKIHHSLQLHFHHHHHILLLHRRILASTLPCCVGSCIAGSTLLLRPQAATKNYLHHLPSQAFCIYSASPSPVHNHSCTCCIIPLLPLASLVSSCLSSFNITATAHHQTL